jgi:hypothetical protein
MPGREFFIYFSLKLRLYYSSLYRINEKKQVFYGKRQALIGVSHPSHQSAKNTTARAVRPDTMYTQKGRASARRSAAFFPGFGFAAGAALPGV